MERGREPEGGLVDDVPPVSENAVGRAMHLIFHRAGIDRGAGRLDWCCCLHR